MSESSEPKKKLQTDRSGGGDGGRNKTAVGTESSGWSSPGASDYRSRVVLISENLLLRFALKIALQPSADVIADWQALDYSSKLMVIPNLDVAIFEFDLKSEPILLQIERWNMEEIKPRFLVLTRREVVAQFYQRFKRANISICLLSSGLDLVRLAVTKVSRTKELFFDPEISPFMAQKPFENSLVNHLSQFQIELLKRIDFDLKTLSLEFLLREEEVLEKRLDLYKAMDLSIFLSAEIQAKELATKNGLDQLPTFRADSDDQIIDLRLTEVIAKWLQAKLLASS